jgi:hypothetical protein
MISPTRLFTIVLLFVALACVTTITSANVAKPSDVLPDADAVALVAMSEQAMHIARATTADAVLRQIDTDLDKTIFHFTGSAATGAIQVVVPNAEAQPSEWIVEGNLLSPLAGHAEPHLDLEYLKLGPNCVAQAVTDRWSGCSVRGLILHRADARLTWTAFCTTSEGIVSASVDAQTGVVQPFDTPPAPIPETEAPLP